MSRAAPSLVLQVLLALALALAGSPGCMVDRGATRLRAGLAAGGGHPARRDHVQQALAASLRFASQEGFDARFQAGWLRGRPSPSPLDPSPPQGSRATYDMGTWSLSGGFTATFMSIEGGITSTFADRKRTGFYAIARTRFGVLDPARPFRAWVELSVDQTALPGLGHIYALGGGLETRWLRLRLGNTIVQGITADVGRDSLRIHEAPLGFYTALAIPLWGGLELTFDAQVFVDFNPWRDYTGMRCLGGIGYWFDL